MRRSHAELATAPGLSAEDRGDAGAGGANAGLVLQRNVAPWLVGDGESAELIRSKQWSQTPLGPLESWPRNLRAMVSVEAVLGSRAGSTSSRSVELASGRRRVRAADARLSARAGDVGPRARPYRDAARGDVLCRSRLLGWQRDARDARQPRRRFPVSRQAGRARPSRDLRAGRLVRAKDPKHRRLASASSHPTKEVVSAHVSWGAGWHAIGS
jgi:hypothetical protein